MSRVVVAGGGPVGAATALLLSRGGASVTLLDSGRSATKICGEGILPAGWAVMEELGLASSVARRAPISEIVYAARGPRGYRRLRAPLSRPAFGVERKHLMEVFAAALRASEVKVWEGSRLEEMAISRSGVALRGRRGGGETFRLDCDLLIGADGLHSTVRRKAGLQLPGPSRYRRWGTRCYFRSDTPRERVEVTLGEGVESYLTPLGGDLYGLAFLWSPHLLGRPLPGSGETFRRLLQFMPPELLKTLPLDRLYGENRAVGPLQQRVRSPLHPGGRVALVGDAAGYLDALTGEGLCLGLRQASVLADCVLRGRLGEYPRLHRRIKFRHRLVVSGLLWSLHRKAWRDRLFSALAAAPRQFEAALGFAVEEAPWSSLLTRQSGRFLRGLAFGE